MPATRLSRRGSNECKIWAATRLAWRSLVVTSAMLVASSCILAPPPAYRDPVQTRPLLEVYKAVPPITDIVVWSTSKPSVTFTVPVRSEDAGEPLYAHTFLDYGTSSVQQLNIVKFAASTYADQSRTVVVKGPPATTKDGCHVFTVIVAHLSSFSAEDGFYLDPNTAGDDAAIVSWWMNINAPENATNTLMNCPRSGLPAQ